jgi:cysteine desulfurase
MDHHATTPVDPRVFAVMAPYFTERFGNAASRSHRFGWEASAAVEEARVRCANAIHAEPSEIVFTSGATESINTILKGLVAAHRAKPPLGARLPAGAGRHIITTAVEHSSVLDCLARLETDNAAAGAGAVEITRLSVDSVGRVDPERIAAAIRPDTILVSVICANNEIGTLNPIAAIGRICRARGVAFHTDATQAVGRVPIDVRASEIDLLSASAHKFYGPKGVGFTYIRHELEPRPLALLDGGGHERGMRSGTLNVPGIVGMGEAVRIAVEEMAAESARVGALRDRLEKELLSWIELASVNGDRANRLPGNLNIAIPYVEGEALLMGLREVALSTGSACTTASMKPSHVLRNIGLTDDLVHASIRFGLGRFTTDEEVDYVVKRVIEEVARLRELSPQFEIYRRDAARGRSSETIRREFAAPGR